MSPHPRASRDPSPAFPAAAPPVRGLKVRRGPPGQPRTRSLAVKEAARQLRVQSTRSEKLLWNALRGRRIAGLKFRRQHPLGRFVLDFYCPDLRLAVEIDGDIHSTQKAADEERQRILESMGIRFVRLPTKLVEDDLLVALRKIEDAASSNPSPLLAGEGSPTRRRG